MLNEPAFSVLAFPKYATQDLVGCNAFVEDQRNRQIIQVYRNGEPTGYYTPSNSEDQTMINLNIPPALLLRIQEIAGLDTDENLSPLDEIMRLQVAILMSDRIGVAAICNEAPCPIRDYCKNAKSTARLLLQHRAEEVMTEVAKKN
jgi:hypothetical protein